MATVTETPARSRRSLARRGVLAILLSVLSTAIILGVAQAAGIAPGFEPLTWPPVIFLTVVGAVGAVAVYWLLVRVADDPDRTFTIVATVVLVLSYGPDFFLLSADENATVIGVAALLLMHTAVAAVCVAALTGRFG
ncbi:DUF6069 family protein [Natrinema marinum]|uniref:DUF6069 family protein n=1 Tax=Natrinema marinum TaxID=2961598 RepID=UPI0020C879C4|nr:DUF6069 family protein [Natrinema marinum]